MAIESGQTFPQSRKLKKADGTIAYVWDNKLHNWDGPALIPEGNQKKSRILSLWNSENRRRMERNKTSKRRYSIL
jgi:hypothetical protein